MHCAVSVRTGVVFGVLRGGAAQHVLRLAHQRVHRSLSMARNALTTNLPSTLATCSNLVYVTVQLVLVCNTLAATSWSGSGRCCARG